MTGSHIYVAFRVRRVLSLHDVKYPSRATETHRQSLRHLHEFIQSLRVHTRIIQKLSLLTLAALLGCQAQSPIEPQPSVAMRLPTEFSQSYQISFQENPRLTAQRFLRAYDNFAKYGPVNYATVQDHARLQMSLERGQMLGGILAVDLNDDGLITRIEYETLSRLPNGNKKSERMAGLFEFDENKDDLMTFEEAIKYGQTLNERLPQKTLRPIESYLMLFDLNEDGEVMRDEVVTALYAFLPQSERAFGARQASRP